MLPTGEGWHRRRSLLDTRHPVQTGVLTAHITSVSLSREIENRRKLTCENAFSSGCRKHQWLLRGFISGRECTLCAVGASMQLLLANRMSVSQSAIRRTCLADGHEHELVANYLSTCRVDRAGPWDEPLNANNSTVSVAVESLNSERMSATSPPNPPRSSTNNCKPCRRSSPLSCFQSPLKLCQQQFVHFCHHAWVKAWN